MNKKGCNKRLVINMDTKEVQNEKSYKSSAKDFFLVCGVKCGEDVNGRKSGKILDFLDDKVKILRRESFRFTLNLRTH